MRVILVKSDIFGAMASTLCILHCLATPFLFMAHSSTVVSGGTTPIWWQNLDYIFLAISFLAVARSAKNTSKNYMKLALWASWVVLFLLILNEKTALVALPEMAIYSVATTLALLHMYNLKFCQCKTDNCCTPNG